MMVVVVVQGANSTKGLERLSGGDHRANHMVHRQMVGFLLGST
jgi:hypothetical protein